MQLSERLNSATTKQLIVVAFILAVAFVAWQNRVLIQAKLEKQ